ncbi:MAG: transporter substrate-binding domain-containing protein [Ruminococcaceae bacterium]|nr:transporter substrate-binding domain-containing protein [Oscillospiraceae bacterium]
MKKVLSAFAAVIMAAAVCAGCSSVKPNEVFSVADLTGKTIGVQLGTTGDIYAEDEVEDAKIERYKSGADAVQALKQGKVDAVIIDNEPAKVFVSKNSDLKILDEEFITEEYAIAIKKGNTELTDAINTALAELKADGTMDTIAANWIGDEKGSHPYVSPEGIEYPNGTLIMATNAQFPPYELVENGEVVGFDVDMMRAVCDKLGYQLEIENMDFDSIITAVSSGKAHVGAAGMTVTEDRLKNIDFSDSYTTATQVIIVRAK